MSDLIPIRVYDPRITPRVRTAVDRLALKLGEVQLVNGRTDTDVIYTRSPDAVITATKPTGSTTTGCLGAWAGKLNDTFYVVSAWLMTSNVAIFTQNLSTGTFTEITNAGGSPVPSWGGDSTGKNRFATTTGEVSFAVIKTKRHVNAGTVTPARDLLFISNGEDYPLVYDPQAVSASEPQVVEHRPINVPTGATLFQALCTWPKFWQVKGSSGKTYASAAGPPRVNQTNWSLADTGSIYTGTNACILLTQGGAGNIGDVATVKFTVSADFLGPTLNTVWEQTSSELQAIFAGCTVEIAKESGAYSSGHTWVTLYDPTSSDPSLNRLPDMFDMGGGTRFLIPFSLAAGTTLASRTAYHLRFVRTATSTLAKTARLICVASAPIGGGFPFGTEWTIAYSDHYGLQESRPIVMTKASADKLENIGGPRNNDANPSTPIFIPLDTSLYYDYWLKVKNPDSGNNLPGGLQGEPSHIDLYFRDAANEDVPTYYGTYRLRTPGTSGSDKVWGRSSSLSTITLKEGAEYGYGTFGTIDWLQRDPGIPAPSDFNTCAPIGAVTFVANRRLFVGNTKEGSVYDRSDLRFSDLGFFGRFRSVLDITDPASGGSLNFEGETVQAGVMTAAAAQGASTIYTFTDKKFYALGTAGGLVGSGYQANELINQVTISTDGTREARSITEQNGVLFWVNQHGQIIRYAGGRPENISYKHLTSSTGTSGDIVAAIPSARRGKAVGAFFKHRYLLFTTPAGGTDNTSCAVWNEPGQFWESIDTVVSCERAVLAFDSAQNGAGNRLVSYGRDGKTYGYEEGSGTVAFEYSTGDLLAEEVLGKQWRRGATYTVSEIEIAGDADTGNTLSVACYPDSYSGSSAYTFTFAMGTQSNVEWLVDNTPSGQAIQGRRLYFKASGTLTGGKKITGITAFLLPETNDARAQG